MSFGQFMPMTNLSVNAPDPFFSSLAMLLHFNGANGDTAFPDSSNNKFVLNRFGDTKISTDQSVIGGASVFFDGSGDYLTCNDARLNSIPADFTVEFWMNRNATTGSGDWGLVDFRTVTDNWEPSISIRPGNLLVVNVRGTIRFSVVTALNVWYHVALVRKNGVWMFFLNGTRVAGNYNDTAAFSAGRLTIGTWVDQRHTSANYHFDGYLDEFRYTLMARYDANFIPSTRQFPDR